MNERTEQHKEQLHALANDARLINATEHLLYPILQGMKKEAVDQMCAKFRGGEDDLLTDIARITVLDDLIRKLRATQIKGNTAHKELEHGDS